MVTNPHRNDNQQTLLVSPSYRNMLSPMGCAPGVNQTDYSDEDVALGLFYGHKARRLIEHSTGRYYEEGRKSCASRGLFARNVSVDGVYSHRELLCFLPENLIRRTPTRNARCFMYDWEEVRTWMYNQIKHRADVYIIESLPYNEEELKLSSGSGAMHTWYPDRRKSKRLKRASGHPVETERMIIRRSMLQTVNGFLQCV